MIHIKDKIDITAEQARFLLEKETSRFGVCIDLDKVLDYQADLIERFKPMLKPFRELGGSTTLLPTERNDIIRILLSRFNLPQHKLLAKNKVSLTTAIVKELLKDPTIDEVTKEFLKIYRQLKVCGYNISYLDQYADLPLLGQESFEGHRMVLAQPEWSVLSTSRISAKKPSLQNIAKHFADIITVPKGYIMVFADSGQIEPRVTYSHYIKDPLLKHLIVLYNDAYWGMVHFVLMEDDEESIARSNISAVEKKELPKALRDELKLLLLVGNYGGDLERGFDPMLTIGFRNKLQNHPMRKLWEEEVTEAVRNGTDTFYAAFGTPITPEETAKYTKGSPAWIGHLVRCGINNPIQGTASELMCQSVYEAERIIREKAKGYTTIGYYKHDEGFFNVAEEDAELVDELAGCLAYQVEGWIPIYSDKHVGQKVAKPIKDLEDLDVDDFGLVTGDIIEIE
jgi:hypothetical protein